jgi:DNA-binding LacI/PurR family transcriptional regulator
MDQSVRLKDLAHQAGVSIMTVSRALRGLPGVSEKVRATILEIAKESDYHSDPLLSSLSSYRKRPTEKKAQTIVFLCPGKMKAIEQSYTKLYYDGIKDMCDRHGFHPQDIAWPCTLHQQRSLLRQLLHQGHNALIFENRISLAIELDAFLQHFVCLKIGAYNAQERIASIACDSYSIMWRVMSELKARAYQRIAFLIYHQSSTGSSHIHLATFHQFLADHPTMHGQSHSTQGWSAADTKQLISNFQPDVIISHGTWILNYLEQLHYRVPEEIGFCDIDLLDPAGSVTGIHQQRFVQGQRSVIMMKEMLAYQQYGLSSESISTLIKTPWVEGKTLRYC